MVENDPLSRIRALERLRSLETRLIERVEPLRRWLICDFEEHLLKARSGTLPEEVVHLLQRPEEWWRPPSAATASDDAAAALLRLPVVIEAIRSLPGSNSTPYSPSIRTHDGIDLSLLIPPVIDLLLERTQCARQAGLDR